MLVLVTRTRPSIVLNVKFVEPVHIHFEVQVKLNVYHVQKVLTKTFLVKAPVLIVLKDIIKILLVHHSVFLAVQEKRMHWFVKKIAKFVIPGLICQFPKA